jgi:hypothetical protein
MKAWHIAAAVIGVGVIMVLIRNMQQTKTQSAGASSNDVILGLSKFGAGLLDLGGKIFTPSASTNAPDNNPASAPYFQPSAGAEDYIG